MAITRSCDLCGRKITDDEPYVSLDTHGNRSWGRWTGGWLAHFHSGDDGCYERFDGLVQLLREQAENIGAIPVASEQEIRAMRRRHRGAVEAPTAAPRKRTSSVTLPDEATDGATPLSSVLPAPRPRLAILRAGYRSLEALNGASEVELLGLDGVGRDSIDRIVAALAERGLSLNRDLDSAVKFGERLRGLREASGLSRPDCARALRDDEPLDECVYETDILRWEKGRKAPSKCYLERLAALFGVTVAYLNGEEE